MKGLNTFSLIKNCCFSVTLVYINFLGSTNIVLLDTPKKVIRNTKDMIPLAWEIIDVPKTDISCDWINLI